MHVHKKVISVGAIFNSKPLCDNTNGSRTNRVMSAVINQYEHMSN